MGMLIDPLGAAYQWGISDTGPFSDVRKIEAALRARGVPFLRDFSWKLEEWVFIVDGLLVARGGALGLLEADMVRWWRAARQTHQ
jgi:hypothetical protein